MTSEDLKWLIGMFITVAAIIYSNGRTSGKMEAWMKGHENLDTSRFKALSDDMQIIKEKLLQ